MANITIKNKEKKRIISLDIILENEECFYLPNVEMTEYQRGCQADKSFTTLDALPIGTTYTGYIRMVSDPVLPGISIEKQTGGVLALNEIIDVNTVLVLKFQSTDNITPLQAINNEIAIIPQGSYTFEYSLNGITDWSAFLVNVS